MGTINYKSWLGFGIMSEIKVSKLIWFQIKNMLNWYLFNLFLYLWQEIKVILILFSRILEKNYV